MLDILMHGVSTRKYAQVLPETQTTGVSKSQVSREFIESCVRVALVKSAAITGWPTRSGWK
jgi:hypothetical protein